MWFQRQRDRSFFFFFKQPKKHITQVLLKISFACLFIYLSCILPASQVLNKQATYNWFETVTESTMLTLPILIMKQIINKIGQRHRPKTKIREQSIYNVNGGDNNNTYNNNMCSGWLSINNRLQIWQFAEFSDHAPQLHCSGSKNKCGLWVKMENFGRLQAVITVYRAQYGGEV